MSAPHLTPPSPDFGERWPYGVDPPVRMLMDPEGVSSSDDKWVIQRLVAPEYLVRRKVQATHILLDPTLPVSKRELAVYADYEQTAVSFDWAIDLARGRIGRRTEKHYELQPEVDKPVKKEDEPASLRQPEVAAERPNLPAGNDPIPSDHDQHERPAFKQAAPPTASRSAVASPSKPRQFVPERRNATPGPSKPRPPPVQQPPVNHESADDHPPAAHPYDELADNDVESEFEDHGMPYETPTPSSRRRRREPADKAHVAPGTRRDQRPPTPRSNEPEAGYHPRTTRGKRKAEDDDPDSAVDSTDENKVDRAERRLTRSATKKKKATPSACSDSEEESSDEEEVDLASFVPQAVWTGYLKHTRPSSLKVFVTEEGVTLGDDFQIPFSSVSHIRMSKEPVPPFIISLQLHNTELRRRIIPPPHIVVPATFERHCIHILATMRSSPDEFSHIRQLFRRANASVVDLSQKEATHLKTCLEAKQGRPQPTTAPVPSMFRPKAPTGPMMNAASPASPRAGPSREPASAAPSQPLRSLPILAQRQLSVGTTSSTQDSDRVGLSERRRDE